MLWLPRAPLVLPHLVIDHCEHADSNFFAPLHGGEKRLRGHSNCLGSGRPCCTSIQHAGERHDQTVTECVHEGAPEQSSIICSPSLKVLQKITKTYSGINLARLGCWSSTTLRKRKKPSVGGGPCVTKSRNSLASCILFTRTIPPSVHSFSREYRYLKYNDFCKWFSFLL